jgi:hypothetical protein
MFDLLGEMAKGIGKVVGTVTGLVVGVPLAVIAETLGLTTKMVKEAMDAGWETYEEIKNFHH